MSSGARQVGAGTFWADSAGVVLERCASSATGLSAAEAAERLRRYGPNLSRPETASGVWRLALRQVENPLVLLLVGAALVSWTINARLDATIIVAIVLASAFIGFWQERAAGNAVRALLRLVAVRARALRDGTLRDVPVEELVVGDVVSLTAGSIVPADLRLLESNAMFVDEAALTGESFAAEKSPEPVEAGAAISGRRPALYCGTHVVSGTATAVVVATGADTEFGHVLERLRLDSPPPDFERGLQQFGLMLVKVTAALLFAIFALAAWHEYPLLDALMFALAISVGMTPELLPAIVSVNLARGARRMARRKVIVKGLDAIEDLGSMTVLCSDKTGTLTEGRVEVAGSWAADGPRDDRMLELAAVNATLQAGLPSPIDDAIRGVRAISAGEWTRIDELPYDFSRKRVSVLVEDSRNRRLLVTKGAFGKIVDICSQARMDGALVPIAEARARIDALYEQWSRDGVRVLGIAERELPGRKRATREDESGMTFAGFLTLSDVLKADATDSIERLAALGVRLKIISGDNRTVACALARSVGFQAPRVMTGEEIARAADAALPARAADTDVFAEVEPNQKERILTALKRGGAVVGFLGDGINDAPALHAADVGISVDGAVDVAKEAADIVLLEHDLRVLAEGVREGRQVFANTLKYIYITTSANFGNMLSMALVVPFLPFLPLTPVQILLNNFLSDFPAMTIGGDHVDEEVTVSPGRWDVRSIRRFMFVFGAVSSAFDMLTFATLLLVLRATAGEFRSAWFLVSLLTEIAILLVMRTKRPLFRSRPSPALLWTSIGTSVFAIALIYMPWVAPRLGFVALHPAALVAVLVITSAYVGVSEIAKRRFFGVPAKEGETI